MFDREDGEGIRYGGVGGGIKYQSLLLFGIARRKESTNPLDFSIPPFTIFETLVYYSSFFFLSTLSFHFSTKHCPTVKAATLQPSSLLSLYLFLRFQKKEKKKNTLSSVTNREQNASRDALPKNNQFLSKVQMTSHQVSFPK